MKVCFCMEQYSWEAWLLLNRSIWQYLLTKMDRHLYIKRGINKLSVMPISLLCNIKCFAHCLISLSYVHVQGQWVWDGAMRYLAIPSDYGVCANTRHLIICCLAGQSVLRLVLYHLVLLHCSQFFTRFCQFRISCTRKSSSKSSSHLFLALLLLGKHTCSLYTFCRSTLRQSVHTATAFP